MKPLKLFLLLVITFLITFNAISQVAYNPFVANIMNQVNSDSVKKYLRQLSGDTSCIIGGSPYTIATRYWNSTGNIYAAQYILERFQSFGLTSWYQDINATIRNVLAKKVGTKYPNQYVIICGHYDDMPSGSTAPGADDNASGVVCVIEAARLLANVNLPYTIIFAAWDEEERGLYGSKAYADTAYAKGDSIIAVLNFDMIAYDGNNDGALDINTNSASMSLANDYYAIVNLYQPTLVPQITTSLSGGSDHQSFQNRGYKAILAIEDNSDFNPYYHTVNDKYQYVNLPFTVKMVKAGIAALVTIAGDFKITINHTPLSSGPSTGPRIATAVIKSSYKIATGSYAPRLYYKVNNGPYNYVNPSYTNLDTYKFTIPGQPMGSTINYYIAAQDSAGTIIATLPSGGSGINPPGTTPPPTTFSYEVANVNIVTVGNGTVSVGYPYYTYYMDSRTQLLYLQSEMVTAGATAGNIHKIGFNVISNSTQPMNGFTVRMQNSTATSLSGWITTGWTDVFSGTYTVPGTGIQYVNLQTPFYWDGVNNLLIEICFHNTSWTSNSNVYATSVTGRVYHHHLDNSNGCQMTGSSSTTGRPNITIYFNLTTGISNNNGIPKVYELSQNYPNPFNPVTKINYAIPKNSFVTLKIYDLLGREVATLINEEKPAGYYSIDFDASNLSSGIYFYRLSAGDFIKTMKMTLMK
ncbi:MAG: M20/M25/M40 family metallo-hydrolase [Ignavibacteria bacterium]|nr:M20/M25/M40 family metallo-hydrolase [Ignavibacteria bacterium]